MENKKVQLILILSRSETMQQKNEEHNMEN